jgi:pimeloyl-ACP methyl ester carboxylesterase
VLSCDASANESVEQVIDTVDQVVTNIQNSSSGTMDRKQIVQELTKAGLDQGIAMWLASSFEGSDFGFDLSVVHDILPEFATQDFYGLLNESLTQNIKVDLVRGGKNQEWNSGPDGMSILRELEEIQRQYPDKFTTHVLPKAGHWIHVDDTKGLVQLFATK